MLILAASVTGCSDLLVEAYAWLDIVVATSGPPDPDGYRIAVVNCGEDCNDPNDGLDDDDQVGTYVVSVNETLRIQRPVRAYRVEVSDVDGGCTVEGGADFLIDLSRGDSEVRVDVTC